MLYILLLVFIAVLMYRILDISVTLHYTEESMSQLQTNYDVVLRYHRTPCDDFDEASEESSFVKDGHLVVKGVKFLREKDNTGILRLIAK